MQLRHDSKPEGVAALLVAKLGSDAYEAALELRTERPDRHDFWNEVLALLWRPSGRGRCAMGAGENFFAGERFSC